MTSQIDKRRALELQAQRLATPELQLRTVADEQPRSQARMHSGGFDRVSATSSDDTYVAPHRSVSQILRTAKITALGRMIRDQACEEQGARVADAFVGIALNKVLPGKDTLDDLFLFFDHTEGRPKVGHIDRQNGTFVQNTAAESRIVDTSELERALHGLIGEIGKADRLTSVRIKTAPQFLSN